MSKKKISLIFVMLISILIAGLFTYNLMFKDANSKIKAISSEETNKLQIKDYFPSNPGSSFYFVNTLNKNTQYKDKQIVKLYGSSLFNNIDNQNKYIVETYSDLANGNKSNSDLYEISQDSVKVIHNETLLGSSDNKKIILCNKPHWDRNEAEVCYITGIDMKINTKAGTFNQCIEVTIEEHSTKHKYYSKEYYAPKIGLVLKKYDNNYPVDIHSTELIKYDSPEANFASQTKSQSEVLPTDNNNLYISYFNKAYNFSLHLPKSWDSKYSVKESTTDNTVCFDMTIDGKSYGSIFTIQILNKELQKNDIEKYGMQKYICTNNGKTFVYTVSSEPSTEALNNKDILNLQMKMVNEDVPEIVKTINFIS